MFKLLSSDGMLVKRPLLITGNKVLTGFWSFLMVKCWEDWRKSNGKIKRTQEICK